MAKALTVKSIEALKKPEKRLEIPDGGMPGLYLVVQTSGAKAWAIRYRHEGRPRKKTIGSFPAYGLAAARAEASALLRIVTEGKDPVEEERRAKQEDVHRGLTVDEALNDFIKRHIEARNRPSTIAEHTRLIERNIRPKWKSRLLSEIRKKDVVELLDGLVDRGAEISANRLFALLRTFFNWAMERDLIEVSPIGNIKPPSLETSRDRVLTDQEVRLVWKASDSIGFPFGPFFKLLLLLGQRRDEVASARWSEFRLEGEEPIWTIPKERAKNNQSHVVPLAPKVVEILKAIPRIKGESDFVFTTTGNTPVSGFSRAKTVLDEKMMAIAKKDAEEAMLDPSAVMIDPWRIHDLRRTCASGMAALGHQVHVVEAILNHRSGAIKGVAAVYNRYDYAVEKRLALTQWANSESFSKT